ncbi:hypothetical protein MPTK2_8g18850 [Marchantia polymorpha subsp. ruderalis]
MFLRFVLFDSNESSRFETNCRTRILCWFH